MAQSQETAPEGRSDSIRIIGLVAACNRYQRALADLVRTDPWPTTLAWARSPDVRELSRAMLTEAEAVEARCAQHEASPYALPTRSRRAYQWLRFLGEPSHLGQHLHALHYLTHEGGRRLPRATLQITLYLTSNLYQVRARDAERGLTVHEGFVSAPEAVLNDVLQVVQTPRRADAAIRRLRTYAAGPDFRRVQADLLAPLAHDGSPSRHAQGTHHDLNAAFDRVNQQHFAGRIARPYLKWSRTQTRSKFGHYDPLEDTVMVSATLDDARVPAFVVDFIVYHELLHKSLGIRMVNGQRRAHTAAFRRAERAHPHYRKARSFLATLTRDAT